MLISKLGIQIFHMHFKIRYHPSIFEKYREHYLKAVGVYKECCQDSSFTLVGHVPIELPRLVASFLGASKMNLVSVQVCRNRNTKWGLLFLDFNEQE